MGFEREWFRGFRTSVGFRLSAASHVGSGTVYRYADDLRKLVVDSALYSGFNVMKTYSNFEPRVGVSYSPVEWLAVKASFNRTAQYQHLLSCTALGLPTDIWVPADANLRPQTADAFSVGVHAVIPHWGIEAGLEAYAKKFSNAIDFKDNADLLLNEHYETEIRSGRGRAKGLEFMLSKNTARYSVAAGYTLSGSQKQIDDVRGGRWYYNQHSQKHNFNINGSFLPNEMLEFSASWTYHSGTRATLPTSLFMLWGNRFGVFPDRNSTIMPAYHRLDVSARVKLRSHGRFHHHLDLSVYNVYGRKNAYTMYNSERAHSQNTFSAEPKVYMMYLYRFVPSVSYVFEF